jgi:hypothetical protein
MLIVISILSNFELLKLTERSMMVLDCNPRTLKAEVGESEPWVI